MLDEMGIAELRSTLRGCLLTPTDPGFEEDCVADRHPADVLELIESLSGNNTAALEEGVTVGGPIRQSFGFRVGCGSPICML